MEKRQQNTFKKTDKDCPNIAHGHYPLGEPAGADGSRHTPARRRSCSTSAWIWVNATVAAAGERTTKTRSQPGTSWLKARRTASRTRLRARLRSTALPTRLPTTNPHRDPRRLF